MGKNRHCSPSTEYLSLFNLHQCSFSSPFASSPFSLPPVQSLSFLRVAEAVQAMTYQQQA